MAVWLHERGIGEVRAALVEQGRIVEAHVEPDGEVHRIGAVLDARLLAKADASGRGRVTLAGGGEAELTPVPRGLTEGASLRVRIVRLALPERGRLKPPRAEPAPDAAVKAGDDLLARIAPSRPADLDEVGWSELIEEAASGLVAWPDAMLRISLTPAMTLIDVDGSGAPAVLALAGARRAGEAIRLFGLAGSIGIDLPTLPAKADRLAVAAALDAALPPPFERTAVNGFGFLQIVRRRERPSLPELLAADPAAAAARALLRRGERARGHGALTLTAAPLVLAALRPDWQDELARRIGAIVRLSERPDLPIWSGHAQRDQA